jgi:predicted transcriptional regulator
MNNEAILLSIQPRFAKKILAGEKKVELRRMRPRVQGGDLVIIYASSPVMAVIGSFIVDHVVAKRPRDLWPIVKESACISREEFETYYEGCTVGVGIFISKARPTGTPLRLEKIRQIWPDFHPPQGYRYLKSMSGRQGIFVSVLRKKE